MTRGSTIIWGKDELTRAPAPDAEHIRRDFNSSCGAAHLPSRMTRLHGVRGKKDHAPSSAQPGSNTSPGLCGKLRSQGLAAETMTLQSFPQRHFLVQCVIDVVAVLFAFLLVAVTGVGLAFAFYALLFLSF